ncbi:MAG: DUF4249 family protein [Brumimicrobium sp.]
MKRIIAFVSVIMFLLACETDFSVNGEYNETPIVHCLLDPNEEFHFLKVNKTFLGDGNANEFAAVPDSSYFDNVEATIEEVIGGNAGRTWLLKDTIIENKEPGAFYHPEQRLYYFKADDLDQEAIYRLNIEIDNGKHVVTGQTQLVKDVDITFPNELQQLGFAEADVPANGYRTQSISFNKGTGAVFNAKLRFDYRETTASGTETKSILWNLGSMRAEDLISSTPSFSADGEVFYEFVKNKVSVDDNVTRRTPYAFEIIITAGSEDLQTYMLVNEPTSSLAQNKPTFSNVTGGLGIFSARTSVTQYKYAQDPSNPNKRALSVNSTRELCEGQYTYNLDFCSNHSNDIAFGYSFACN